MYSINPNGLGNIKFKLVKINLLIQVACLRYIPSYQFFFISIFINYDLQAMGQVLFNQLCVGLPFTRIGYALKPKMGDSLYTLPSFSRVINIILFHMK